ncbi:Mth938-like domain-containing protein [Cupriavidus sp. AU9028]|uniref:Mth938-like domain-containing protein n=1 Tax=Cupriavidus sp. AU9028 TaxID=2871157 RepID=UPI001C944AAB|nr:Mth938-like domain-containing protein [Cupriavidus sp. AU9028]MBY4898051.1 Mth938-like domain-containing protein [Cupriavidus sp. AU9028]
MKLHADQPNALNTVTGYGPGYIEINKVRYAGSVVVMPEGEVQNWPASRFEDLAPEQFDALAARAPEVVLLGTGDKLRFPHPRLTAGLTRQRIGIESMDMQAACRTYNILMAEGRRVAAVLLLETLPDDGASHG